MNNSAKVLYPLSNIYIQLQNKNLFSDQQKIKPNPSHIEIKTTKRGKKKKNITNLKGHNNKQAKKKQKKINSHKTKNKQKQTKERKGKK